MIKEFNALDEIQKYYDKENNTYIFKEDGDYIDQVILYFNFNTNANINVANIKAYDITAKILMLLILEPMILKLPKILKLVILMLKILMLALLWLMTLMLKILEL